MRHMDISVIIVSWNTQAILRDCLRSVYEQTKDIDFEVIVVDNASGDGSVGMIRTEFPQVVLIANEDNRGFAAANNQGMAIAQGCYVLLLNSDTLVLEGAIQKTMAFADAHAEAAVIGCRVLNVDRSLQASCFMFPSALNMVLSATYLYKLFPRSRFFGRERMTWWDRRNAREVDVISGCFMLVRREAIDQVGPMDDGFFMYAEETDWCHRFKAAGWKNLYAPNGQIIHLGGQSTARVSVSMTVQMRLSILRFIRKHRPWPVYTVCCVLISLFFLARVPAWLFMWIFVAKSRSQSRARLQAYLLGAGRVFMPYGPTPRGR